MKHQIYTAMARILGITLEELKAGEDSPAIWDSLMRVEVLFAFEDEYNVLFEEDELPELTTPAALCAALLKKLEQI